MNDSEISYRQGEKIGGRYRVVKPIFGGSTEVFLCTDLATDRPYALKTFQRNLKNPKENYERLCREAEIWLALEEHPNIVRCHWIEELDERPFIFLDWIGHSISKSVTLREIIRHKKIDQKFALNAIIDVCRGLQHINQKLPSLVHCDLKPANILVSDTRVAKITDFGFAHFATPSPKRKKSKKVAMGRTAPYASPEQWLHKNIDIRTDIYAIGCILHELLSGQRLFIANSDQEYKRLHLESPLPKIADSINLPLSVDSILEKCLAKNQSDRFADIDELLNALSLLYGELFSESPTCRESQQSFTAADFTNRAYAYINLKKYDLALADLNQAIALNPKLAQAYGNMGMMFVEQRDYNSAIKSLSQAIDCDNSNAAYYANRGFAYTQVGDYAQAIANYSDAIKRDITNVQLHLSRAYIYICIEKFDEALNDYSDALKLDSSNIDIYVHRAGLNYRLNHFQEAIFDYTKAIENTPNKSAKIYHCRGLAYKQIGEIDKALADYNSSLALDNKNPFLFYDRGLIHANLGNNLQSLMDFSNAIRLKDDYFQAYYSLGKIHELMGLSEEALEDYEKAIKINPELGMAYFSKAKILKQMKRFKESKFYCENAQKLLASNMLLSQLL
jgi:serine/threonine protein kinase